MLRIWASPAALRCRFRPTLVVVSMTLDECEAIFDRAVMSSTEAEFCHSVEPLFDEYQILSLEFGRGSIYWRARIVSDEPYANLSEMVYPPPECTKVGRLNDAGAPCFYVSARKETALAEVGAREGDRVQLTGFRILDESSVRLAVIGEYANVQKCGYMHFAGQDPDMGLTKLINAMPRDVALKRIYIDKFFANILADPSAATNGYRFSRALGQSIFARNGSGGIVFPSVKDVGGFNLGVNAEVSDRSLHNVCCFVTKVRRIRRFGLLEFEVTHFAEGLGAEGDFLWKKCEPPGVVAMYGMSKEEYDIAIKDPADRNNLLHVLHNRAKRP